MFRVRVRLKSTELKVNHRRGYSLILAKVCAVAMAMEVVKTRLKMDFVYLKIIQSLDFFIICPTANSYKIPSVNSVLIKF